MGLDMYLNKYPRLGVKPRIVNAIESMKEWSDHGGRSHCSLEEWCGVKESELPSAEVVEKLESLRHISYAAWDEDHRWPNNDIHEQVGYWRKANAIHRWFVEHVQNGNDDCDDYFVSELDLMELRDACYAVITGVKLVPGKVINGYTFDKKGKMVPNYQDGLVIDDPSVCEAVLPTTDGFFFGSTQYNEWYLDDIKYTFELCNRLLDEFDFNSYDLFYTSSW